MIEKSLDDSLGIKTRMVMKRVLVQRFGFMLLGELPTPQYRNEMLEEQTEQWSKLVGILFCMPSSKPGKDEVLPNLEYFHYRSGMFVDFFCIGYTTHQIDSNQIENTQPVTTINNEQWDFNPSEFNSCRAQLEHETKWRYSGETDLLLAVARKSKNGQTRLDYSCAIVCNLEEMIRDGAIKSIRGFFEKIFQFGEQYNGDDPVWKLSDKFGLAGGGQLLQEAMLTLVPEMVRKQYKETKHFVISDISI